MKNTVGPEYASYLIRAFDSPMSQIVQTPYRWHLKSLGLGKTLDVGFGAGRNLRNLSDDSVGVEHNPHLVAAGRARGWNVFESKELERNPERLMANFDSILCAHVAEHMTAQEFVRLMSFYLRYLKPGGRLVLICPQEKGFASDPTHVEFLDLKRLQQLLADLGLSTTQGYSFPFPRWVGKVFAHNEFVAIGVKP